MATPEEREALVPPLPTIADAAEANSPSTAMALLPTRNTNLPSSGSNNSSTPTTLALTLASLSTRPPDAASILFFQSSTAQQALYYAASAATGGIVPLLCHWYPQLHTRLTKRQVATIDQADTVLVKHVASDGPAPQDDDSAATPHGVVTYEACSVQTLENVPWFEFRKSRHFYDAKKQGFVRLVNELQEKYGEIDKRLKSGGLSSAAADELSAVFGRNAIDLPPTPWKLVLLRKVLHPFYLFQVASALIWFSEEYTTYALVIMVLSALSILWEVRSQVTNDQKLHDLLHVDASVKVLRDQHTQSITVDKLVVGDVVIVEEGLVPADLVLVAGECTADESTLTGEAIPIVKQQLLNASGETRLDAQLKTKHKESVLYAGSSILATKADNSSRGVVLATGFSTSKGELFRSIVYPKPINYKIERDSYRFLFALSIVAILAFVKRMIQASKLNIPPSEALTSALDLITIAVPPALPLILTVGVGFAMTRLETANIFCINSQRINVAGHVDTFCFDKTGTLSSDHMDFQGVDECSSTSSTFVGLQSEVDVLSINAIVGLATCHGLNERSGQVTGYALEHEMFKATGYSIETNIHKRNTPNAPFSVLVSSPIGKTFGIVKRYLFDASLQRSSALIEDFESGQRVVYTKGSPEAMMAICNQATIPANFMEKVRTYSFQGYYVVALASKTYPVTADVPQREAMECRLNFLGFILFLNKIKTESPYVISTLEEANVDVRIITGDNAFTAIHVSRKINMDLESTILLLDGDKQNNNRLVYVDVDDLAAQPNAQWTPLEAKTFMGLVDNNELALTGAALEQLQVTQNSLFVEQIVLHAKIFARIRPHQKTWIIETLIKRGRTVGMVGDGTNDCGALKAAHVGIALSDADASIVAPFTSRKKQITDVVELLREGRCALSTSFVAFKFMVLYSIIQVTMSSLMNDYSSQMSNNQFLFDDLVVVFALSILMVRTAAAERLTKDVPAKSLFAPTIVFSLAGQIMFLFICLGIAISAAKAKSWYCSAYHALELTRAGNMSAIEPPCYVFDAGQSSDLTRHSYENSVIWLFGHFQYWIVVVAFNIKDVFRKPFYTNKTFTFYSALLVLILLIQLFSYKSEQATKTVGVDTSMGVLKLPGSFTASLFFLFLFDLLLALVWELLVVGIILNRLQQRQQRGDWGFSGRRIKASAYVADRASLLAGGSDEYGKPTKKRDSTGATSASPAKNDRSGNAVSVDIEDDEEEDVITLKQQEIVYVDSMA